jgi:hypothetical protein
VTVVKRGSSIVPEELIRQLKIVGSGHAWVVLTRAAGRPIALIARAE